MDYLMMIGSCISCCRGFGCQGKYCVGASAALLNLWIRKTALCCRLLPGIISFFRKAFAHEYRKVLMIAQCCNQLPVTHLVIVPSLAGHEMLNLNCFRLEQSYVTKKKLHELYEIPEGRRISACIH